VTAARPGHAGSAEAGADRRRSRPARGEAGSGPTHRVFVAIPLPEAARGEIEALVDAVRAKATPDVRDVRWVRLDGLHLTLRFIGQVAADRVEHIAAAVEAAATAGEPFEVTIEGAGAFPSAARPRALWLGIGRGRDELAGAASAVEDALASVGLERSERPFRAHLTLARSDGVRAGPDVARRLVDAANGRRTSFAADELVLFESVPGGGPARYVALRRAPLAAVTSPPRRRHSDTGAVLPSDAPSGKTSSLGARRKEQGPTT
jgi:2'-5' RNA ligase